MKGVPWPKKVLAAFKRRYPHEPTAKIAADLGITISACYQMAGRLGIKKSAEYLASPAACRLRRGDKVGAASRFLPGHVPANKGLRRPGWAPGRMAATQFKPGNSPQTTLPVGSYRFAKDGSLQRKIGNAKGNNSKRWRGVHELVWIEANGPLPPGHICVFKAGMRTAVLEEITADRVECITLAENMQRNSYHNRYPKEIGLAIQARGQLIRKIRRIERQTHTTEEAAP